MARGLCGDALSGNDLRTEERCLAFGGRLGEEY